VFEGDTVEHVLIFQHHADISAPAFALRAMARQAPRDAMGARLLREVR
jgi:hypothetical protein